MIDLTASASFRYLGVTDECVECQQCGRADLRSTVVLGILDADGNVDEVTWYGSDCAARALGVRGGSRKVLAAARAAHRETVAAAETARELFAHYGVDAETGDVADMKEAVHRYRVAHRNALWFDDVERGGFLAWVLRIHHMIRERMPAIRDERLLLGGRPAAPARIDEPAQPADEPAPSFDGGLFDLAPAGALF